MNKTIAYAVLVLLTALLAIELGKLLFGIGVLAISIAVLFLVAFIVAAVIKA